MPLSTRPRLRAVATFAVAATAATMLPLVGGAAVAAAASCVAPSGLFADDALRGTVSALLDPRLSWGPVDGASSYQLQISPNEDFTNNVVVDIGTVSTRYDVPRTVLKPQAYFWRVRVAGATCWSDDGSTSAAQFTIGIPGTPTPLAPADGVTVAPKDFTLAWTPVPEASLYEVVLTDPNTNQLVVDCFTDHTRWSPYDTQTPETRGSQSCPGVSTFGYGLDYVWRVRAIDMKVAGPSSTPYPYTPYTVTAGAPKSGQVAPIQISGVAHDTAPTSNCDTNDPVGTPSGTSAGGQIAVVYGTGFTTAGTFTVTVGGVKSKTVTAVCDTKLLVLVPPSAGSAGGDADLIVSDQLDDTHSIASVPSPRSKWRYIPTPLVVVTPTVTTPAGGTAGPFSAPRSVTLGLNNDLSTASAATAPTGLAATAADSNGNLSLSCATSCTDTPTLSWTAAPGASSYRVYVAEGSPNDGGPTSIVQTYETPATSLTPRDDYLDNQAGQAYYFVVQSCTDSLCGAASSPVAFVKRSTPVAGASPVAGAHLANYNIVLSWTEWQHTTGAALAPQGYHVQIASDCTFANIVDDALVDAPEYVNPDKVYPDGTYYWRVQAVDQSANGLTWDAPNRDTNSCTDVPSFSLAKTVAGASPVTTTGGTGVTGGTTVPTGQTLTVSATSRSVVHVGVWLVHKALKAFNGKALITDGAHGQRAKLAFRGTTLTVGFCRGPLDGYFGIYVDGHLKKTVNSYGRYTICGSKVTITGLAAGTGHIVGVRALGKGAHGKKVALDYFRIK